MAITQNVESSLPYIYYGIRTPRTHLMQDTSDATKLFIYEFIIKPSKQPKLKKIKFKLQNGSSF